MKLIGTQSSDWFNLPGTRGNSNLRGITPMTSYGLRSSRIFDPMMPGSPWKAALPGAVAQHADLLMLRVILLGEDAAENRLNAQCGKTPPVMRVPLTCAGSPRPESS